MTTYDSLDFGHGANHAPISHTVHAFALGTIVTLLLLIVVQLNRIVELLEAMQ